MDNIKRLVTINSLHSPFFELVAIIAVANTIVLFNWLILQKLPQCIYTGLACGITKQRALDRANHYQYVSFTCTGMYTSI